VLTGPRSDCLRGKRVDVSRFVSSLLGLLACTWWSAFGSESVSRGGDVPRVREIVFPETASQRPAEHLGASLVGSAIPRMTPMVIGEGSRVDLACDAFVLRAGSHSDFELTDSLSLKLSSGACLVQPRGGVIQLKVTTKRASFICESAGVFMIEATTNGGAKVSLLSQGMKVRLDHGNSLNLIPGNLVFVLPSKQTFGPKIDVDLRLVSSTSLLINGFKRKLESAAEIKSASFYQAHRIRSRSNAVIGDARTPTNYDVFFMK
jgi:hypothetical protein